MGDVPEQVFIDAASEYVHATGINIIPEALAITAGHRAAVASAYRAGQAAKQVDVWFDGYQAGHLDERAGVNRDAAACRDEPHRWALPDDRETAKAVIHPVLHGLNVRIVGIDKGDCHCNLIAEVVLDALADATPAADGQDGDGRDGVPTRFVEAPDDGDRESW